MPVDRFPSKQVNLTGGSVLNISFASSSYVDERQIYKRTASCSSSRVAIAGTSIVDEFIYHTTSVSYYNDRAACVWNYDTSTQEAIQSYNNSLLCDECRVTKNLNTGEVIQETHNPVSVVPASLYGNGNALFITLFCNIPVFDTAAHAQDYLDAATETAAVEILNNYCVNFKEAGYEVDDSEYYYIYTGMNTVNILRGEVTVDSQSTETYRCTRFMANTPPCLYFEDAFTLKLMAPNVVAGYSLASPQSVFEQVPDSSYLPKTTGYTGNYAGNLPRYLTTGAGYPGDGQYSPYATFFYSNIYIMASEEAAEEAIATGDYSDAINFNEVNSGRYGVDPDFGEDLDVEFGQGTFSSPFVAQYVMSEAGVREVCSIFFTDDSTLFENIERGLKLFGAKPVDAIMSLFAFPFDCTLIGNCMEQRFVYFGSYKHDLDHAVNRIYNQLSNYLDLGSIYLKPIFYNWRDYRNLTLSVYLPYIGWNDLQVEKYVDQLVNIRYYVDLNTRQCVAVLVCTDGSGRSRMCDYFTGEIGVELPIVGSNFADYARSEIQHLGNTAKKMLNPFSLETLSNVSNAGDMLTNTPTKFDNYGMYKFGQNGSPKDMQMTKGSFSSGVGMYLPQKVIFRYDIHDVVEPELLAALAGKPSTASGKISQFSGFLSGRVSKLDTTGMTDNEIQEVMNGIINDGIYI